VNVGDYIIVGILTTTFCFFFVAMGINILKD
jgi:hypothetical protein